MSCAATDNWDQVEADARATLGEPLVEYIRQCRATAEPHSHLISVLHKVQSQFGYLGPQQLDAVAQLLQVPAAKVSGVASFYHFFRLKPRGRFVFTIMHPCFNHSGSILAAKVFPAASALQLKSTTQLTPSRRHTRSVELPASRPVPV